MSKNDFHSDMEKAKEYEQFIEKQINSAPDVKNPLLKNFAKQNQINLLKVVEAYKETFLLYAKYKQVDSAERILNSLYQLIDTCDYTTSHLALLLINTLIDVSDWLDDNINGVNDNIKARIAKYTSAKLTHIETEFWLLLKLNSFHQNLVESQEERHQIDMQRCYLLELGAYISYRRENIGNASAWLQEAGGIAQNLGQIALAEHLYQKASEINQVHSNIAPHPKSIEADFQQIFLRQISRLHSKNFLAPKENFSREYALELDKLGKLVVDNRLVLDTEEIKKRSTNRHPMGLLDLLPSQKADRRGNIRSDYFQPSDSIKQMLQLKYILEIQEVVSFLFQEWRTTGDLTYSRIIDILTHTPIIYDWNLVATAIKNHFEDNFIASIHILIPQSENVLRQWAAQVNINIKKGDQRKQGTIWGDKLLNDLTSSSELKIALGESLMLLIDLYLAKDVPLGYRHKVAHGFLSPQEFTHELSAMLIYLIMRIANTPIPNS